MEGAYHTSNPDLPLDIMSTDFAFLRNNTHESGIFPRRVKILSCHRDFLEPSLFKDKDFMLRSGGRQTRCC